MKAESSCWLDGLSSVGLASVWMVCLAFTTSPVSAIGPAPGGGATYGVTYSPTLETVQKSAPFTYSFPLDITSPTNLPSGASTTVSLDWLVSARPTDATDSAAANLVSFYPNELTFDGPSQTKSVNVLIRTPLDLAGAFTDYHFQVYARGWPTVNESYNLGAAINGSLSVPTGEIAPAVQILTPADATVISVAPTDSIPSISLTVSAAGNGSTPITSIAATVDGGEVSFTSVGGLNSASVSAAATLALTAAGTHVIRASATNSVGTAYTQVSVNVRQFAGGSGTEGDPYQIATAAQLDCVHSLLGAHFLLVADIDLSGVAFASIGSAENPFSGEFDGNGHQITNWSGAFSAGFFGATAATARITNLILATAELPAGYTFDASGLLVGRNLGSIVNCTVTGGINRTGHDIGGVVGDNFGSLTDTFSYANVTTATAPTNAGGVNVGGLAGLNAGIIQRSGSLGNVSGFDRVGGLVGLNTGSVSTSYSTASVVGPADDSGRDIGGLIGANEGGFVANTYASGAVSAIDHAAGLVGTHDGGSIVNSYAAGAVSEFGNGFAGGAASQVTSSYWDTQVGAATGSALGDGRTTAQMQTQSTFAGWDFDNVWTMTTGQYPFLRTDAMLLPTITEHPLGRLATEGADVTFTMSADGPGLLAYQWRYNSGPIAGSTSTTLDLLSVSIPQSGTYDVLVSNAAGTVASNPAQLTVLPRAPTITLQPISQVVSAGADVLFSVQADGGGDLQYQWKKNGVAITGATSTTYGIAQAQIDDEAIYSVAVSNAGGSIVSEAASLTVLVAPAITSNPESQTVFAGEGVTFSVTAVGHPLSYQWSKDGVAISGADSSALSLNSTSISDSGVYVVAVSNSLGGVNSAPAVLTIITTPEITTEPQSQTVGIGETVELTVEATGGNLSYQWQHNGNDIPEATNSTLELSGVSFHDAGSYSVTVTNQAGTVTSNGAELRVSGPPEIITQPESVNATRDDEVSFSVEVLGYPEASYQWRFNGSDISGATDSTYTIEGVQAENQGGYSVVVSNSLGSVESEMATLTVDPPSEELPVADGLLLHLDADRGVSLGSTGGVGQWFDDSGNGNDAYQLDESAQPTVVENGLNGHRTLRFDGVDDHLALPDLMSGATQGEIFIVAKLQDFTNQYNGLAHFGTGYGTSYSEDSGDWIWDDFGISNGNPIQGPGAAVLTAPHIYNASIAADGTQVLRFNGAELLTRSGEAITFRSDPIIGADWLGEFFRGDIAEVLVFNHVLSSEERTTLNQYFIIKYAVASLPAITSQPESVETSVGDEVSFNVEAFGYPEVSYQWRFNGVDIPGATDNTYTIEGAQSTDQGGYSVVVTNSLGSVESDVATLTVEPPSEELPVTDGLVLHLDADRGVSLGSSGGVGQWFDDSGNGNDAYQLDESAQPLVVENALNGHRVLRFNGENDYLALPDLMAGATEGEIFIVAKLQDFTNEYNGLAHFGTGYGTSYSQDNGDWIWDDFGISNGNPIEGPGSSVLTSPHIYDASIAASGTQILRFNGDELLTRSGEAIAFRSDPIIGADWLGEFFRGDVAEVLLFNHVLSSQDRSTVVNYLRDKYRPAAPSLTAYGASGTKADLIWTGATGPTVHALLERRAGLGDYQVVADLVDKNSFTDSGLTAGQTYAYRIRLTNGLGASDYSDEAIVTTEDVAEMPSAGVRLWLRSTAGTQSIGSLARWSDQSGLGNDAVQLDGYGAPVLSNNQINGFPSVHFDQSQRTVLALPNIMAGADGGEAFVVVRRSATENVVGLWAIGAGSGSRYPESGAGVFDDFATTGWIDTGPPAVGLDNFTIYNVGGDDTGWFQAFNGIAHYGQTGNTVGFSNHPVIGGGSSAPDYAFAPYFDGDIAEIIIYDHVLSAADRDTVIKHLTAKYGDAADVDGNGLSDAWEVKYFGHSGVEPDGDADGDGLTNLEEYQLGTNPINQDTDLDGLPDGFEVTSGLNPRKNDAGDDLDGDGISNRDEYERGTNPNAPTIVDSANVVKLRVIWPVVGN